MKKGIQKGLRFLAVTAIFALVIAALGVIFLPLPGTIPILMYHFVGSEEQAAGYKNYVSEKSFEGQMAFLDRLGFRVISLDELYEIRTGQRKARGKEIVLTFDDGNYSFSEKALPVLQQYDFPAAVFMVSESMKQELHGSMNEETLIEIAALEAVTIGSHSKTHPLLPRLNNEQIFTELRDSKEALESVTGRPVDYFAYPSGEIDSRAMDMAEKAGYKMAFVTSLKKMRGLEEGPWSIGRVKISRTADNPIAFWGKVSGLYQMFKQYRARLR